MPRSLRPVWAEHMLVNGKWAARWEPVQAKDDTGRFMRQRAQFRHWITPDGAAGPTGTGGFAAEPDRYHLYVALVCPWASRVLAVRKLKGLERLISVSVVEPFLTDQGWGFGTFPGSTRDPLQNADYLHEIYTRAQSDYTGRATVPVLWDKQRETIVNNESADIVRMLNAAFTEFAESELDLYPHDLRDGIEVLNQRLYADLNNGVYQAGFASSQEAYEEAYHKVFAMLDEIEERLSDGRACLFGDRLTETDIHLFVTLVRFDLAYHGLFKCNRNLIAQMPNLSAYLARMLSSHGIHETVNEIHIKTGYYSIQALNPSGIVPAGPGSKVVGARA